TGAYSGTASNTWTIKKASQPAINISPKTTTVNVGDSVTFTSSGGDLGGYRYWSGDASGHGGSQTVTFNTVGTRYVSVTNPGDANWEPAGTATATIYVVEPKTPLSTLSLNRTSFTYNGSSQGPSVASVSPSGATYSTSGTWSA